MLMTTGLRKRLAFRASPLPLLAGLLLAGTCLAADASMKCARAQSAPIPAAPVSGDMPAVSASDPTATPLHKLGVSKQDHRVRLEHAGWPWTSLGRVTGRSVAIAPARWWHPIGC